MKFSISGVGRGNRNIAIEKQTLWVVPFARCCFPLFSTVQFVLRLYSLLLAKAGAYRGHQRRRKLVGPRPQTAASRPLSSYVYQGKLRNNSPPALCRTPPDLRLVPRCFPLQSHAARGPGASRIQLVHVHSGPIYMWTNWIREVLLLVCTKYVHTYSTRLAEKCLGVRG